MFNSASFRSNAVSLPFKLIAAIGLTFAGFAYAANHNSDPSEIPGDIALTAASPLYFHVLRMEADAELHGVDATLIGHSALAPSEAE